MDRQQAHLVLATHLPDRRRRWLLPRRVCRHCGRPYPCPTRQAALDQLANGARP